VLISLSKNQQHLKAVAANDKIKQGEMLMQKNYYADKKLHLESISLVQNPVSAWCKILLETSLADCFFLDYCTV